MGYKIVEPMMVLFSDTASRELTTGAIDWCGMSSKNRCHFCAHQRRPRPPEATIVRYINLHLHTYPLRWFLWKSPPVMGAYLQPVVPVQAAGELSTADNWWSNQWWRLTLSVVSAVWWLIAGEFACLRICRENSCHAPYHEVISGVRGPHMDNTSVLDI